MIDKNKQYRTRDGHEVRIYATDGFGNGAYCIHGAYKKEEGWVMSHWDSTGRWSPEYKYPLDLIEVKPRIKREYWVNVYSTCIADHDSKTEADNTASSDRIACVKVVIDCEEGEGL